MEDRVSRESKLHVTKEIVSAYIKSMGEMEGEDRPALTIDEICEAMKRVYGTVNEMIPDASRKIGLGV